MSPVAEANEHEPVVRLWTLLWVDRDTDGAADLLADPYVRHSADGVHTATPAEYTRQVSQTTRHLKGTAVVFHHLSHDGDLTNARFTLQGVNLNTGDPVAIGWIAQYRIVDGHLAESWSLRQTDFAWSR